MRLRLPEPGLILLAVAMLALLAVFALAPTPIPLNGVAHAQEQSKPWTTAPAFDVGPEVTARSISLSEQYEGRPRRLLREESNWRYLRIRTTGAGGRAVTYSEQGDWPSGFSVVRANTNRFCNIGYSGLLPRGEYRLLLRATNVLSAADIEAGATDDEAGWAELVVVVTVTGNNAPKFDNLVPDHRETLAYVHWPGLPPFGETRTIATVSATDLDGDAVALEMTTSWAGFNTGMFDFDPETGEISYTHSQTHIEVGYYNVAEIRFRATDRYGASTSAYLYVYGVPNYRPVFEADTYEAEVNGDAGSTRLFRVHADDPNGDNPWYVPFGDWPSQFRIDMDNGDVFYDGSEGPALPGVHDLSVGALDFTETPSTLKILELSGLSREEAYLRWIEEFEHGNFRKGSRAPNTRARVTVVSSLRPAFQQSKYRATFRADSADIAELVTVAAVDPSGGAVTYEESTDASWPMQVSVNAISGVVSYKRGAADIAPGAYTLSVLASNKRGAHDEASIVLTVLDPLNLPPPSFSQSRYDVELHQFTVSGPRRADNFARVAATDPAQQTIRYSAGGIWAGWFTIDAESGELSAALVDGDGEEITRGEYPLGVLATTADGRQASANVLVTVPDRWMTLTNLPHALKLAADASTQDLYTVTGEDPDGDPVFFVAMNSLPTVPADHPWPTGFTFNDQVIRESSSGTIRYTRGGGDLPEGIYALRVRGYGDPVGDRPYTPGPSSHLYLKVGDGAPAFEQSEYHVTLTDEGGSLVKAALASGWRDQTGWSAVMFSQTDKWWWGDPEFPDVRALPGVEEAAGPAWPEQFIVSSVVAGAGGSDATAAVVWYDGNRKGLAPGVLRLKLIAVDPSGDYGETTIVVKVPAVAPPSSAGICDRTEQVRDAIMAKLNKGLDTPEVTDCAEVTAADLSGITGRMELSIEEIPVLKSGDFQGLSNLDDLQLIDSGLETLPEDVFDGLTSLTKLYIIGNDDLEELPEGIFAGLTSLTNLHVSGNAALGELPEGIFGGLTSLGFLHLAENSLTELPEDIFDGLTSLQLLHLQNNQLTGLPAEVFDGLANLEYIRLNENALRSLPGGVFDGLASLKQLPLEGNGLESLPEGLFEGLVSLEQVFLSSKDRAPFTLTAELERRGDNALVVKVVEGSPFDLTVTLSARGGTLSSTSVTVEGGSLASGPVGVSVDGNGPGRVAVTVESATFPEDREHSGIEYRAGPAAGAGLAGQPPGSTRRRVGIVRDSPGHGAILGATERRGHRRHELQQPGA